MSRIGRLPITVPAGVDVTIDANRVTVSGARGTLERTLPSVITVRRDGDVINVERPTDATPHRALHGLTRTLVNNMVQGVSAGFTRELELVGVGFRAAKQGSDLVLTLGYSHPIRYTPPEGITIDVPTPTVIAVSGADKEVVGQVAAKIRSFRKPEPYKGKGVLYRGERL
ncbi:MAG: 50S ribosomal protein L6, partial [Candidatus Dormibacteraeota bacterium]|nr:50S ribosomal protein L6 [Candidatus Dormibacteraeota bacterium]